MQQATALHIWAPGWHKVPSSGSGKGTKHLSNTVSKCENCMAVSLCLYLRSTDVVDVLTGDPSGQIGFNWSQLIGLTSGTSL